MSSTYSPGRQLARDLALLLIGLALVLKYFFGATLNSVLAHLSSYFR